MIDFLRKNLNKMDIFTDIHGLLIIDNCNHNCYIHSEDEFLHLFNSYTLMEISHKMFELIIISRNYEL